MREENLLAKRYTEVHILYYYSKKQSLCQAFQPNLSKTTKTIFSAAEFDALFKRCEGLMMKAMTEIKNGQITPLPFKDEAGKTACDLCDYNSICLFDAELDAFRFLRKVSRDDFDLEGNA